MRAFSNLDILGNLKQEEEEDKDAETKKQNENELTRTRTPEVYLSRSGLGPGSAA